MKSNKIKNISTQVAKIPRNHFNLSHDVNTTFGFGDIQPMMCQLCVPGTKSVFDTESLIRLAPLLSPVFGRMKLKIWHNFVACSDLSRNFKPMMSQQSVDYIGQSFVPQRMLYIPLNYLSALCFVGASFTPYTKGSDGKWYSPDEVGAVSQHANLMNALKNNKIYADYSDFGRCAYSAELSTSKCFNYSYLAGVGSWNGGNSFGIPIGDCLTVAKGTRTDYVSFAGADYVYEDTSLNVAFAFRFSAFGKRLRKVLIGLGYQLDLTDDIAVNALPLFAYYKSYFDSFGLCLYDHWEDTSAYSLLNYCDINNVPQLHSLVISGTQTIMKDKFWDFIRQLGNTWYTDSQDFVSAHTVSDSVSPRSDLASRFVDVHSAANIEENRTWIYQEEFSAMSEHGYINGIEHGQLDSEYLKLLYRWTNRNTIAGQKIADLLRAQGLGDYVDSTKSTFIGYTESPIQITDVTSTSDTFDSANNTGSLLGEFAGKGVQYDKSKSLEYENDEFGYIITMAAIVPESGYCQGLDTTLTAFEKFDFYHPDYDGLGMELTEKQKIFAQRDCVKSDDRGSFEGTSFGFVPRYSGFKVKNNISNGDFSRRGSRSAYLPYTFDKFIPLGDVVVDENKVENAGVTASISHLVDYSNLPVASNVWRYPSRYAWLSNFERIFANTNSYEFRKTIADVVGLFKFYDTMEFIIPQDDNILCHSIFNYQMYAPMKPIEDSFGTVLEGERANSSMTKA